MFLRTQMAAHHPGGARRDDFGSFAYDWDDWEVGSYSLSLIQSIETLGNWIIVYFNFYQFFFQSLLRKLYELFYMDLQHQNTRTRFTARLCTVDYQSME